MAYTWFRFILFSKNWLSSCCRLLLQVPDHQKDSKFYIQCSHQRTRNDLLRIWKATESSEVTMDPATQPRIQNSSCRIGNRTQNQFSSLSTEQWFGRIHGQGIQESNWKSCKTRSTLEPVTFRLQVHSNLQWDSISSRNSIWKKASIQHLNSTITGYEWQDQQAERTHSEERRQVLYQYQRFPR